MFDELISTTIKPDGTVEEKRVTEDTLQAEAMREATGMFLTWSPSRALMGNGGTCSNLSIGRKRRCGGSSINAALGELIDEGALADALKSGHLGGAALDVFVGEPTRNTAPVQPCFSSTFLTFLISDTSQIALSGRQPLRNTASRRYRAFSFDREEWFD